MDFKTFSGQQAIVYASGETARETACARPKYLDRLKEAAEKIGSKLLFTAQVAVLAGTFANVSDVSGNSQTDLGDFYDPKDKKNAKNVNGGGVQRGVKIGSKEYFNALERGESIAALDHIGMGQKTPEAREFRKNALNALYNAQFEPQTDKNGIVKFDGADHLTSLEAKARKEIDSGKAFDASSRFLEPVKSKAEQLKDQKGSGGALLEARQQAQTPVPAVSSSQAVQVSAAVLNSRNTKTK